LGFPLSRGFPSLSGSVGSSPRNAFLAFHPRDAVIITASIEAFADIDPDTSESLLELRASKALLRQRIRTVTREMNLAQLPIPS
jgi:3-polyprenyl-4-hydroxybenzoate decarboxylase